MFQSILTVSSHQMRYQSGCSNSSLLTMTVKDIKLDDLLLRVNGGCCLRSLLITVKIFVFSNRCGALDKLLIVILRARFTHKITIRLI